MNLKCICGNFSMSDAGHPNNVEHVLLDAYSLEKLETLVDEEVSENGQIDMWPEHLDTAGAVEIWKCLECGRLYINPSGNPEEVIVYSVERKGIDPKQYSSIFY
jgi:hypothetical protein